MIQEDPCKLTSQLKLRESVPHVVIAGLRNLKEIRRQIVLFRLLLTHIFCFYWFKRFWDYAVKMNSFSEK